MAKKKDLSGKPKKPASSPRRSGGGSDKAVEKNRIAKGGSGGEEISSPEVQAVGRYLKISPTKMRGVLDLVRGEPLEEARRILKFSSRRGALMCLKVLDSAIANARRRKDFNEKSWIVSDIRADKGPVFRRKLDYKARFGRGLIKTCSTHLTIKIKKERKASDGA